MRQAGSAPGSAASTPNTTSVSSLTENGNEDSMNSNTEADICYLQAEVERLIQHEVKTKGIVRLWYYGFDVITNAFTANTF